MSNAKRLASTVEALTDIGELKNIERTCQVLAQNAGRDLQTKQSAQANDQFEFESLAKKKKFLEEQIVKYNESRDVYQADLERAKERAHILEGLIIAVNNIDEVIKIIKGADNTPDARQKLRARFNLSEKQADAILDLRLARLNKLEVTKLQDELKALKKTIEELTEIVGSKQKQMAVVKKELLEVKKNYKDERRSRIVNGGEVVETKDVEDEFEVVEDFVIAVTHSGNVKKMSDRNFASSDKKLKPTATDADFIKKHFT